MTPWEKLAWLHEHAHIVHVETNDHRAYYETVAQVLATRDEHLFDDDEEDVRAECIRRNELVRVQVYPQTPIGFYIIGHYDLAAAVDKAYEVVHKELTQGRGSTSAKPTEDE